MPDRRPPRAAKDERLDQLLACLYQDLRLPSPQIARLTGMSEHAVRDRLRARGVPIRTRGRPNREDREVVSPADLAALYLQGGLSADETGRLLGVSRTVVLRSAHDQGLTVRVGGLLQPAAPPRSSCSPPCTPTPKSAAPWPGTASRLSPWPGRSGNASPLRAS
ncbi:MAG: hypothetical protein ACRDP7_42170 [Trebonia sp.]